MADQFHIVTAAHGISGAETYVKTLVQLLSSAGQRVTIWKDGQSPDAQLARTISPFNRQFPRGGILILIGSYLRPNLWITHAQAERVIFICNTSDPAQTFRTLAVLAQPGLPPPEVVYVSSRLRDGIGIPGILSPEIVDTKTFAPTSTRSKGPITVGRLSRDDIDKHHPDDPALYRMLVWEGTQVRVMGGHCLSEQLGDTYGVSLLATGSEQACDFLNSLDVFFYRTSPRLHEAAGRVVMEALACGLPVIAHTSGGYTDWIEHGRNGFLFKTQEEALSYLRQLSSAPEQRQSLGHTARITAQNLAGFDSPPVQEYLRWLTGK